MRKIAVVFMVFVLVSLVYACCKEIRYKTTLWALAYSGKGQDGNETDTIFASQQPSVWLVFRIDNSFTEIAMGTFISQSMAKGGEDCNDYIQEKYEDPIAEMLFTCDRDLLDISANQDFPDYHFGFLYRSPYEVVYHEKASILEILNENTTEGSKIWLSMSATKFLTPGIHKFTVTFKTQSGRVIQAASRDLVVVL